MEEITDIECRNCRWCDSTHTAFTCELRDPDKGWISYTCTADDAGIGRFVWAKRNSLDILGFAYKSPTYKDIFTQVQDKVQELLDNKAKELNYDNGFALASYATSTIPKFRNEATKFVAWRDSMWAKCYEINDQYLSGTIPMPTVEDVMNELPELLWDEGE